MAQDPFLINKIEDGERLLPLLADAGPPLVAAYWASVPDGDGDVPAELFLVLADASASEAAVYQAIRPAVASVEGARRPRGTGLQSADVRVIDAADPVARDIIERSRQYPDFVGRWHRGDLLGRQLVTGLYVYPLPAPATA